MKIAVSAQEKNPQSHVDPRFGRAKCFMVYDDEEKRWEAIDNQQNLQAAQGAGIQSAANVVNAGCNVLIGGHCGPKAFDVLSKAEVSVYAVEGGTVEAAVDAYRRGVLKRLGNADVEGHW
ncbi:MAG: NifB/NifX family molybdenum-iron cluster-binding protein [Chitinispirillaceae bacterium]|nr:NifB/NifX family molybdenum-iron cluster-binding protein [Chitinispirillaceae bacterium]